MGRISESESRGLLAGHPYHTAIPQDMGGEPADELIFPRPDGRMRRLTSRCLRLHTSTCKLVTLALALLFVMLSFIVPAFVRVEVEKKINVPGSGGSEGALTSKLPVYSDDDIRLAYPSFDQDMNVSDSHFSCASRQIKYPVQTFNLDFSQSRNLSVFQDIKSDNLLNGIDVRVSGDIVFRRAGTDTPGPSVTIEMTSNDDQIALDLDWDDTKQRLYLLTPRAVPWPSNSPGVPCLQIRATVWAPPGSVLDSLNVEGVHMGVKLLDNLSLHLTNFARLASTVGSVVAATDGRKTTEQLMHEDPPSTFDFNSRYIEVKTLSNSITGSWPLYDYLGLESISGAIRTGVQPKAALKEMPRPAILLVHSTTGYIEVYEPVNKALEAVANLPQAAMPGLVARDIIPPRQYGVDIFTMSGSVKASLVFGHSFKVHTTSGSVDLTLLPVLDKAQMKAEGDGSSRLDSSTTSGNTVIDVLDALWKDGQTGSYIAPPDGFPSPSGDPTPGDNQVPSTDDLPTASPAELVARVEVAGEGEITTPQLPPPPPNPNNVPTTSSAPLAIRVLNSHHSTTSAAIRVTYPASWEGSIDANSLTGSIVMSGDDLEIIRRDEEFPGYKKRVLARKGDIGDGAGFASTIKCHTTSGSISVSVGAAV